MRILTSREAAEATDAPEANPPLLVQRAGYAVAQFCAAQFKFRSVCVLCGTGKKGAAGLVAAAALNGIADEVAVIILAAPDRLAGEALAALPAGIEPIWVAKADDFDAAAGNALDADLVLDAVIGTGFKPPLSALAAKAVAAINDVSGTVVSIDVPSGVAADLPTPLASAGENRVFAQGVLALIAPKPAHVFGELTAGPLAVNEIGVQPAAVGNATGLAAVTGQEVGIAFSRRPPEAEKDDCGHVLVIGGSPGRAGAAALAGLAALAGGARDVTLACPQSIAAVVAGFSATFAVRGLPESAEGGIAAAACETIDALLADKDAVVLGPGLLASRDTAVFIQMLIRHCRQPLVIGAGGSSAFQNGAELKAAAGGAAGFRALALGAKEAARLAGAALGTTASERPAAVRRLADISGCCVLLRGRPSIVAGMSGETWVALTGNPALAKAGADEVLCGLVGAALARHRDEDGGAQLHRRFLRDVQVAAAVYLHGMAADIARDALHENTVGAPDLIEALSEAFRDCDMQVERSLFYLRK